MGARKASTNILLSKMITIRVVEEKLLELCSLGYLNGTVHTCIGQEACAVGLMSAIDVKKDIVFSNHRGHGHYISYCGDIRGLVAEIMGLNEGICQGIGGSQHIHYHNFYTNGIQGAATPIVVGMALAEKKKATGAVAVVNLGDGTFGEGAVYEAMNIASLWNLPVIFSVENNGYAQTTPLKLQHAGELSERGRSFGIDVHKVDGMDVQAVFKAATNAVGKARKDSRPQILFMETYRFAAHSKGDDFRDAEEISRYRQRDPINIFASTLNLENQLPTLKLRIQQNIDGIVSELIGLIK